MRCLYCRQEFSLRVDFLRLFAPKAKQRQLCSQCQALFMPLKGQRCLYCDRESSQSICPDCQNWQQVYGDKMLHNQAIFPYDNQMQNLLLSYKELGDYALHQVLAELIASFVSQVQADYYIPIPSSQKHLVARRFENVAAIFENLLPLTPVLAKKTQAQEQQRGKSRRERLASPQPFCIRPDVPINLQGRILLLDDVYTTGRTLYHARDCLWHRWPQINVNSFTICR